MFQMLIFPKSRDLTILLVDEKIPSELTTALLFQQSLASTKLDNRKLTSTYIRSNVMNEFPLDAYFSSSNQSWQAKNCQVEDLVLVKFVYPSDQREFCLFNIQTHYTSKNTQQDSCVIVEELNNFYSSESGMLRYLAFLENHLNLQENDFCREQFIVHIVIRDENDFDQFISKCKLYSNNIYRLDRSNMDGAESNDSFELTTPEGNSVKCLFNLNSSVVIHM